MAEPTRWQPDWAVPPGETLAEALQEREMSQSELARRMDRPVKTINEIVNGKAAITADTAIQLERALGISATFWNALEAQYRERLARGRAEEELAASAPWLEGFPIGDLTKHGLIPRTSRKGGLVEALLSYFRVSSPAAWEREWMAPSASFRSSPTFASAPKAVAAWLRWGEIEAADVDTAPFDARRFREALVEIRRLTRREPFLQILRRVQDLCASAGVAVVVTPELRGARLSGAARWLTSDKALIQLSYRHKSDDHFWFSFFHEAGHLLERKRRNYLHADDEAGGDGAEEAADRFARDALLPPQAYKDFTATNDFGEEAVRAFAKEQGVAQGIVVGRLQRDGLVPRTHLNPLKRRIDWPKPLT